MSGLPLADQIPSQNGIKDCELNKFTVDSEGKRAVRAIISDTLEATFSPSGLRNGGRHSEITVNDSSWTALPSTALSDRNAIAIQNNSTTSNIKINYVNNIATYTGMTIRKNGGERQYDIKDTIVIYAKSESGSVTLDIEELS